MSISFMTQRERMRFFTALGELRCRVGDDGAIELPVDPTTTELEALKKLLDAHGLVPVSATCEMPSGEVLAEFPIKPEAP